MVHLLFGSPRFASRSPLGKPKKEITKEAKQKRPRAPKPDIMSVDDDLALLLTKDMSMSEDVSDARGRRPPDPRRRSPHEAAAAVARRTRPGARRQYLKAVEQNRKA